MNRTACALAGALHLAGAVGLAACGARSEPLVEGPDAAASGAGGASGVGATSAVASATSSGSGGTSACDGDGDGFAGPDCGGPDCVDADPTIHPGARDTNIGVGPWVVTRVLENIPGDVRGKPAIFVEPSGAVHVAHGEDGLRYATNRSGAWTNTLVDTTSRGAPSLAVDGAGTVHLAYPTFGGVFYASGSGDSWAVESVDGTATEAPALALDDAGRPHVLYATGEALRLVRRVDQGFVEVAAFPGASSAPSLLATGQGRWAACFSRDRGANGPELELVTGPDESGSWTESVVSPSGPGPFTSLTRDAAGALHIGLALHTGIQHAEQVNGAWASELVTPSYPFSGFSLAADPVTPGRLHLVHDDQGVHHARREGGVWTDTVVVPFGYGASLAVDADGALHLAHSGFAFDVSTYVDYVTNRALLPDGVDQNCDGVDGVDADQDGFASVATGGKDCDDLASAVFPGAPDPPQNGIDEDCDGLDGAG